jgi:hypothetical protein
LAAIVVVVGGGGGGGGAAAPRRWSARCVCNECNGGVFAER